MVDEVIVAEEGLKGTVATSKAQAIHCIHAHIRIAKVLLVSCLQYFDQNLSRKAEISAYFLVHPLHCLVADNPKGVTDRNAMTSRQHKLITSRELRLTDVPHQASLLLS